VGLQARTLPIVLSVQAVPPLYYYLMDVWSAIFGLGHVSLRIVSAVGGALGPVFLWWAARSLRMSRGAAIVVAVAAAVSPLSVWFSQFAREFSLTATTVAAWLWLVARVAHEGSEGSRKTAAALTLTTFLGFSLSYHFAAVILGGLPALLLIAWRARSGAGFGRCARAVGVGMALWLLYTPFLIVQTFAQFQRDPASVTVATVNDLTKIFTDALTVGPFNTPTSVVSGLVFVFYAQIALGLILFFALRGSSSPADRRSDARFSWAFFLFCSSAAPILILFCVSRWAVF